MFIRLTAGKMGPDGSYNSQLEIRGKRIRQEGILGLKDKYRILRKGADGFCIEAVYVPAEHLLETGDESRVIL